MTKLCFLGALRTHNAGVEGSSPSLSTNKISQLQLAIYEHGILNAGVEGLKVTSMRLACLLVLILGCNLVHAACEIEPGHYRPKLSESAAKARDTFYEIDCIRAGGNLIDSTDPTLASRLELPSQMLAPSSEPYGRLGVRLRLTEAPVLVYLLDASGSIHNVGSR